ncbi:MAG: transketolase family protein, partial [Candidatus Diapherotrites archaeon]|nr:transketolase family protein [Candidatus Diapherotrites archaeon]
EGNDVSLIACGPILNEAIQASAVLKKQGISASVVNMPSIKPLDEKLVVQQAKKTGRVLTIEDHVINGGLGSAVAEALGEHFPARMQRVGVQNVFAESGSPKELYGKYGLDAEAIVKKAKNLLRE